MRFVGWYGVYIRGIAAQRSGETNPVESVYTGPIRSRNSHYALVWPGGYCIRVVRAWTGVKSPAYLIVVRVLGPVYGESVYEKDHNEVGDRGRNNVPVQYHRVGIGNAP